MGQIRHNTTSKIHLQQACERFWALQNDLPTWIWDSKRKSFVYFITARIIRSYGQKKYCCSHCWSLSPSPLPDYFLWGHGDGVQCCCLHHLKLFFFPVFESRQLCAVLSPSSSSAERSAASIRRGPIISGSFAERDLQLRASFAFSPPHYRALRIEALSQAL